MRYLPSDLKAALDRIQPPSRANTSGPDPRHVYTFVRHAPALHGFEQIATALEPGIDLSLPADRSVWAESIWPLRFALLHWHGGGQTAAFQAMALESLVRLAEERWVGVGGTSMRQLPFPMADRDLEFIARRDLASMEFALAHEQTKLAIVAGGAVIEAVLVDLLSADPDAKGRAIEQFLKRNADEARTIAGKDPASWSIRQLVQLCGPDGLGALSEMTVGVARLVKDYRDVVHPNHERKRRVDRQPLDQGDGSVMKALVDKVLAGIAAWRG